MSTTHDFADDLAVDRGYAWSIAFVLYDACGKKFTLDGYAARMEIDTAKGGAEPLVFSSMTGHVHIGSESGVFNVLLRGADTTEFSAPCLQYRFIITSPDGEDMILTKGRLSVLGARS